MFQTDTSVDRFTDDEVAAFSNDGFLIQRSLIPASYVQTILDVTRRDTRAHFGDIEYEADVQYPGAPESLDAEGGRTIRRLRQAFSRDPVFSKLVKEPFLLNRLRQLVTPPVVMPLTHHNCIMTKHPKFSSDTGWHQDMRYWSFQTSELVNAWVALGDETLTNGCLRLIPGSHRIALQPQQLDAEKFFRDDVPETADMIASAVTAELAPGDVLFFHARCLHSATRNYSEATKYSAVFTFRSFDNTPIEGSRSARLPELLL